MVTPESSPKLERKAEATSTLAMPSAPQQRAWAKGRPLETHTTTVVSKSAASSLNLRTLIAQVPVSSDGKMFSTTRLPARSALVTELRSCPTSSKPGSWAPWEGSSPTVETGSFLKLMEAIPPSSCHSHVRTSCVHPSRVLACPNPPQAGACGPDPPTSDGGVLLDVLPGQRQGRPHDSPRDHQRPCPAHLLPGLRRHRRRRGRHDHRTGSGGGRPRGCAHRRRRRELAAAGVHRCPRAPGCGRGG